MIRDVQCSPSKEGHGCKCSVEGGALVISSRWIDLACTAESSESIVETRTHEADDAQHDDLGYWMVVETLNAGGALKALDTIVAGVRVVSLFYTGVGHGGERRLNGRPDRGEVDVLSDGIYICICYGGGYKNK